MNKEKLIIYFVVLCLLSFYVLGAESSTVGNAMASFYKLNITMVNHEPSPAEAGRYVTIRFKIENQGRENAESVMLELLPRYPFSLDPGESAVKQIGSIYSKQTGAVGVIKDYRLKVDENSLEGDNKIEAQYKIGGSVWTKVEPFYINIKPHDILLSITKVDSPKMIKPGSVEEVKISLKNMALSFIKDIKVKLNLNSVPFATFDSTNAQIVKQLDADSNTTVIFNLIAEPDAESKLYKVPIEVEFLDRLGTKYSKNETVGLSIGAEPDLTVNVESSEVYSKGGTGKVTIKFVNKGVTDIKFLNIKLKESDNYDILSPSEVYIGNIDSDDYETADFTISLKKAKGDYAELSLLAGYKDANNNDYSKSMIVPLQLYSTSEAKALGLKKSSKLGGFLIIVIIVAGGIVLYRWKKKNMKKKK